MRRKREGTERDMKEEIRARAEENEEESKAGVKVEKGRHRRERQWKVGRGGEEKGT